MDWVWILGAIFSAWTVLRVIGAERTRRMNELIVQLAIQESQEPQRAPRVSPPAAPVAALPPVRPKAAR
jgi:hypothetical protein